jgi:hypothetical protein
MFDFLASHAKHILTIGFVIGMLSLCVRYLDEKISTEKKMRFEQWIRDSDVRLKNMTLASVHGAIRRYRWICLLFVLLPWTIALVLTGFNYLALFIIGVAPVIHGCVFLFFAPRGGEPLELDWQETFESACREIFKMLPYTTLFGISCIVIGFLSNDVKGNYIFYGLAIIFYLPAVILCWSFLIFLPLGFLHLLRIPVRGAGGAVQWLSSYPKGPWAGLVFALTMLLGIFRLFM